MCLIDTVGKDLMIPFYLSAGNKFLVLFVSHFLYAYYSGVFASLVSHYCRLMQRNFIPSLGAVS